MEDIDILSIHSKIRKRFADEKEKLPQLRERLEDLNILLKTAEDLKPRVKAMQIEARNVLLKQIKDLEQNMSRDFYNSRANGMIADYNKIMNTTIKKSFMKKNMIDDEQAEKKKEIVCEFLELAREYIDIEIPVIYTKKTPANHRVSCSVCDNKKDFAVTDEHLFTCLKCFAQETIVRNTPSWNDIGRANLGQKYVYDRRVHFRDCMLQYQGKQNCTIPQKVYTDLVNHLELHSALKGKPGDPPEVRYVGVTKRLIRDFLTELGYNKHYENVHLIHYILSGIKPDDISHLEEILMDEFDQLTTEYDRLFKHLDRKSFVSTQCVLFQLLRKHKHPCKQTDFNIIKTPERKNDHDDILRVCFSALNWSYSSIG